MTSYQIYYPTLKCIFLDKFHFFHQYTKLLYRHNIVVRVRVMVFNPLSTIFHLQSNLYLEVMFGTKKNWTHKTGDLLKEVQFIWNFLWQNKTRVTFQYRWLLNRGDRMGRFDCILKWSVLLVEATKVPGENHWPAVSHW
jgi:hypothetical protein